MLQLLSISPEEGFSIIISIIVFIISILMIVKFFDTAKNVEGIFKTLKEIKEMLERKNKE